MSCEEGHQDNLNIFEYYLNFIGTVSQNKNTPPKDDIQTKVAMGWKFLKAHLMSYFVEIRNKIYAFTY